MVAENAIYIMAKAPVAGQVKTRLCPPLTPQHAATFYAAFLHDTLVQARKIVADVFLMCPTQADAAGLATFATNVRVVVQDAPGLSAGLCAVFRQGSAAGYTRIMALSSDNPTLPPDYLDAGFAALDSHAISFGPSSDGGYYFVAASQPYTFLFTDMQWSTPQVLTHTLNRARHADLSVFLAPEWYDIDSVGDLPRLLDELNTDGVRKAGEYTRKAVQMLRQDAAIAPILTALPSIQEVAHERNPDPGHARMCACRNALEAVALHQLRL